MRLVLMIAGGILLAFCLLPFLGVIGALLLCVLVIGVAIYSLTYTGTKIASFMDGAEERRKNREERRKKREEHIAWIKSLPKDERNAQIKQEIKNGLGLLLLFFLFFGIPIIIFIFIFYIASVT